MRKRRIYLALLILAVAGVAGLIVAGALREREPEYGGKRLSEWVRALPLDSSRTGSSEAEVAVRQIGTNAFPYLLKWVDYEPAAWKLKVYEALGRLQQGKGRLYEDKRMLLAMGAARAFGALGAGDPDTEDKLFRLQGNTNGSVRQIYVALALIYSEESRAHRVFRGASSLGIKHQAGAFNIWFATNASPAPLVSKTNAARALGQNTSQ